MLGEKEVQIKCPMTDDKDMNHEEDHKDKNNTIQDLYFWRMS